MALDPHDPSYFKRLFLDPKTRVTTRERVQDHADAVLKLLPYWGVEVNSVIDVGCGLGWWRSVAKRHGVEYFGIDFAKRSRADLIVDYRKYRPRKTFDLVICQGVIHYLDDEEAAEQIDRIQSWARKGVVFMDLTREDGIPSDLPLRQSAWYRRAFFAFEEPMRGLFVRPKCMKNALALG